MKNQALFSSKYKTKKLKCRLLRFLFGALGSVLHSGLVVLVPGYCLSFFFALHSKRLLRSTRVPISAYILGLLNSRGILAS